MSTSLALILPWRHRRVTSVLYGVLVLGAAGWIIHALTSGPGLLGGNAPSALPAAFGLALLLLVVLSLDRVEALMRRMAASSDLGILFDPGQSIDASLYGFARTLRACLEVDECIVVLQQARSGGPCLYMVDGSSTAPRSGARLDARLADALLALPPERAVLFSRGLLSTSPRCRAFDDGTLEARPAPRDSLVALGHLLEALSFVSAPLRSRSQALGRVFLLSHRRRLARRDASHLAQLTAQAGPLIENMQLVEKLAQSVATQERRRISRDLHDGTVQPYIGLKLGLEALRRRVATQAPLAGELDELIRMAGDGISQLRSYVGTLSQPDAARARHESLVQGLRQQVDNFSRFYAIQGSLCADREIVVPGKLYDEVLCIVREALSNIRRHTGASRASVTLRREPGALRIEIANNNGAAGMAPFQPHSIAERVKEIGGRLAVDVRPDGETVVAVEIPF